MRDLRAVAFDLDDTLWEIHPVLERAELAVRAWLGENCPRIAEQLTLEEMRAARVRIALEEPAQAHDMTYLRRTALARHAREFGYEESIAEAALEVFLCARNEIEPFEDVLPALERLRSRYVLATLSNGNADLERIGLASWFSLSLNARLVGAAKPHPRCFEQLASALALPPASILYVGDDPVRDVEAARAAGFSTAWMNRRGEAWPEDLARADLVVRDCLELAHVLESVAGPGVARAAADLTR